MRVGIYLNVDSYLAHADLLGAAFLTAGWQVDWLLESSSNTPRVTTRQIRRLASQERPIATANWRTVSGVEQVVAALKECDVVLLGVAGPLGRRIIRRLKRIVSPAPICVACFPGVHFAGQTLGQWSRLYADLILFNEPRTYDDYRAACGDIFHCDPDNAILFGYPTLTLPTAELVPPRDPNLILYVDQMILPLSWEDRMALLKKLNRLALSRPKARLVIAARTVPGEVTSHHGGENAHILTLVEHLRARGEAAKTMSLTFSDPRPLVRSAGLCLGITSTLLIEAMYHGTPTVPLRTAGVTGPFDGCRLFQHSPMAMTVEDLIAGASPQSPNIKWRDQNIFAPTEVQIESLLKKIERIRRNGIKRRPGSIAALQKWMVEPFCTRWDRKRHAMLESN